MYTTCYIESSNITRRIIGNKPHIHKLVIAFGSDIAIFIIV